MEYLLKNNLVMPSNYVEVSDKEMEYVNGEWSCKGFFGYVGTTATAGIVGGTGIGAIGYLLFGGWSD